MPGETCSHRARDVGSTLVERAQLHHPRPVRTSDRRHGRMPWCPSRRRSDYPPQRERVSPATVPALDRNWASNLQTYLPGEGGRPASVPNASKY